MNHAILILKGLVRRAELEEYGEVLPALLVRSGTYPDNVAEIKVSEVIGRARLALTELDHAANSYNEAEDRVDTLVRAALRGSKWEMPIDRAEGEGRR